MCIGSVRPFVLALFAVASCANLQAQDRSPAAGEIRVTLLGTGAGPPARVGVAGISTLVNLTVDGAQASFVEHAGGSAGATGANGQTRVTTYHGVGFGGDSSGSPKLSKPSVSVVTEPRRTSRGGM